MLRTFAEPLAAFKLLFLAIAVVAGVSIYCLLYNGLQGRTEGLGESLGWAATNVLPWLLGFEVAKRARALAGKCAAIALALLTSLAPDILIDPASISFELLRRVPALGAVLVALFLLPFARARQVENRTPAEELPLLPSQIEWVSAAGNYVELRGGGRSVIRRSTLAAVEVELAAHGFVRVHRSTLVRRNYVARVRKADLILRDGTSIKTGARYRSGI